jgi:hypothetical protein
VISLLIYGTLLFQLIPQALFFRGLWYYGEGQQPPSVLVAKKYPVIFDSYFTDKDRD